MRNVWAATMRRATLANIASKVRLMQGVGPFLHLCKPRFTRSDAGGGRDEPSARLHVRVFSAEHGVDRRVPRPAAWPGTGFVRRAVNQVRRIKRPGLVQVETGSSDKHGFCATTPPQTVWRETQPELRLDPTSRHFGLRRAREMVGRGA